MKLVRRQPLKQLAEKNVRQLYVSEEIASLLDGKTQFGLFPNIEAEKRIGIFSAGYLLRVSGEITKKKPDLERLAGFDDVWSFCIRRPPPGWRLLGRFLDKDRLILTRAWPKGKLAKNYEKAAKEVIADWQDIFGEAEPFRRTGVKEYLSGAVRNVDEEE
jgi:hypothetical protein